MYKYKLGPKAISYTNAKLGVVITPSMAFEAETQIHLTNLDMRRAVANAHIIVEFVENSVTNRNPESLLGLTISEEELTAMTRKDIMNLISFMEDEDIAKAASKATKADLIAFIIEVRAEYSA